MPLESIRHLVQDDLLATDHFIMARLESNIPLVKQMIEYVLSCGGKRVRPLVLLLSARALTHRNQQHIDLAAVIELIHTATLLHDDVVDSSTLRRGQKRTPFGEVMQAYSLAIIFTPAHFKSWSI